MYVHFVFAHLFPPRSTLAEALTKSRNLTQMQMTLRCLFFLTGNDPSLLVNVLSRSVHPCRQDLSPEKTSEKAGMIGMLIT